MDQNASLWNHCLRCASISDVGLRRANNQDSRAIALATSQEKFLARGHLFVVADGMGAHAAGELASKVATDVVPLAYHKLTDRPAPEALLAAVREANSQIHSRGQAAEDFRGMGTTLSALLILPEGAVAAQVGDSRVYRWRSNCIEQLTFDHSLVWEMRAAGQIPADQTPSFIPKNVITRSLGPNPEVAIDLEGPFPIQVGDTFLLCSDGLSGQVQDDEIGKILGCLPPDDAVRSLVDLANLRGGPDNITVIVVQVTGPQVARAAGAEGGAAPPSAPARPVHPLLWILLGVFGLAAVGLAVLGQMLAALLSLVAAGVAGVLALVQRYGGGGAGVFDGRRLGRGPYSAADCAPDARFARDLTGIVQQLRDAAANEDWQIDWSRFNGHSQRASATAASGDFAEAVRQSCQAISFMMSELKMQRGRKRPGNGTSVPLE